MNKSKFLKKSLAMLLALMLVVAMIPLSASAALPDDLEFIYVGETSADTQVAVKDQETSEVDVKTGADVLYIRTNEDLTANNYELRVQQVSVGSTREVPVSTTAVKFKFDNYRDANGVITLKLYDTSTAPDTLKATYKLHINEQPNNTTTNVQVTAGQGVVSVDKVDLENKVVEVTLARHTGTPYDPENTDWDETLQKNYTAQITVTPLENAKVNNGANGASVSGITANNGSTFTVVSESGSNTAIYTVKATYEDALDAFSITGTDGEVYAGSIVDANKDDVPDTIQVVLPVSAIWNSHEEPIANPELAVTYEVNGNQYSVSVGNTPNVKSGDKIAFTGLESDNCTVDTVTVTRLDATNGAKQVYALDVSLEKSSDTAITYAQVNKTIADVDLDAKTITANVPKGDNLAKADVILRTSTTVEEIVLDNITLNNSDLTTSNVNKGNSKYEVAANGAYAQWTFDNVDLTSSKIVTVTAQDGTFKQYTLVANRVTNDSDATLTAFWVKSPDGRVYEAEPTPDEDDWTVTVDYMDTVVGDWTMFVTPSTYSFAASTDTNPVNKQLVSGSDTLAKIMTNKAATAVIPVGGELTGTVYAVNKNDTKITKKYTIHFVLGSADKGNTLSDLTFTTQPTTTDNDKTAFRAITDANSFDADVSQKTDGSHTVGTLNLKVPASMYGTDDLGVTYQNIVTSFVTNNGGVAFFFDESKKDGESKMFYRLTALTNDVDEDGPLSGDILSDGDKILVLDEETARWAMLAQLQYTPADKSGAINANMVYEGNPNSYKTSPQESTTDDDALRNLGVMYTIHIEADEASSKSALKTMSVKDFDLTINPNGTITGTLPYSLTADPDELKDTVALEDSDIAAKATFVEFTMDDYARMIASDKDGKTQYTVGLFSNGDIEGDGIVDDIDISNNSLASKTDNVMDYKGFNNYKLVFVRDGNNSSANQSVTVYRYDASNAGDVSKCVKELSGVQVRAEDRVDTLADSSDISISNYTFDLKWAAPCEEADITSFKLGNYTGVIDNDSENGRTIKVQVPYGTSVTGMIAEFTTSTGATVKMNDVNSDLEFISGVTSANYSAPVVLYITSEDGDTTHKYTVTVEEGISFSDVNSGAWYYDNVMNAAENGYVSGYTDGTYRPLNSITRAEFASMIAKAMGYEANPDAPSMFPDVADNFWGKAAINFCVQNDIISGYSDGTFQPNKAITRQEAAAILNNAFKLAEEYGVSSDLFADDAKISGWAETHVYAAKASGLMKGDAGTNNFRPTSSITRAEAASILMNAKYEGLIK